MSRRAAHIRTRTRRAGCVELRATGSHVGQNVLGDGIAVENAALATGLDIEIEVDRDPGVARPSRVGRCAPVSLEISRRPEVRREQSLARIAAVIHIPSARRPHRPTIGRSHACLLQQPPLRGHAFRKRLEWPCPFANGSAAPMPNMMERQWPAFRAALAAPDQPPPVLVALQAIVGQKVGARLFTLTRRITRAIRGSIRLRA
jgi:hypothetical protein